jgi:hypothetical protein
MQPWSANRLLALVLPVALAGLLLAMGNRLVGASPAATARFASTTGTGFACSQATPCQLIIAVGAASAGDSIYVKGGIYTGLGPAVITVTKTITIFGGWDGVATGRPYRNPALYPTTFDGQNSRRAVNITGTLAFSPTLQGLIFANGNATGQFAGCAPPDAYGCGGGIFVHHAAARILGNIFVNNTAMQTAPDFHGEGHGGGLYVEVGSGAVISHNLFMSNTAAAVYNGSGGGLEVRGDPAPPLFIQNNQFVGNVAPTWGGGVALHSTSNLGLSDNLFENNSGLFGGGLFTWSASVAIDHNTFTGNAGDAPVFFGYAGGSFVNNLVLDNLTNAGVQVAYGGAFQLKLANNIIAHNGANGLDLKGVSSAPLNLLAVHNTLVGSQAGTGLLVTAGPATVIVTNTLLSGFGVGLTNNMPTNTVLNAGYTLFDSNIGAFGNASLNHTRVGTPAFVDATGRNYHILAHSAARDAGVLTPIVTDIDDDLRPIGALPDIGADETHFIFANFLPLLQH